MKGYGQFCPVAKAAEILTERWTLLVLRELFLGGRRFNDLRKGVPLMSPTLLSKRLKFLERAGVIERHRTRSDKGWEYQPTNAGQELLPVVEMLGVWGQHWVRSQLTSSELDPGLLWMGDMTLKYAIESGRIELEGVQELRRSLRSWLQLSALAGVPNQNPERKVSLDIKTRRQLKL